MRLESLAMKVKVILLFLLTNALGEGKRQCWSWEGLTSNVPFKAEEITCANEADVCFKQVYQFGVVDNPELTGYVWGCFSMENAQFFTTCEDSRPIEITKAHIYSSRRTGYLYQKTCLCCGDKCNGKSMDLLCTDVPALTKECYGDLESLYSSPSMSQENILKIKCSDSQYCYKNATRLNSVENYKWGCMNTPTEHCNFSMFMRSPETKFDVWKTCTCCGDLCNGADMDSISSAHLQDNVGCDGEVIDYGSVADDTTTNARKTDQATRTTEINRETTTKTTTSISSVVTEAQELRTTTTPDATTLLDIVVQRSTPETATDSSYSTESVAHSSTLTGMVRNDADSIAIFICVPVTSLIVLLIACCVLASLFKRLKQRKPNDKEIPAVVDTYVIPAAGFPDLLALLDTKELVDQLQSITIDTDELVIDDGTILGEGQYAIVKKGYLKANTTPVAVKMIKNQQSSQSLLQFVKEATFTIPLEHPHILKCLGVCIRCEIPYLVLPYMANGSLNQFLKHRVDSFQEDIKTLVAFCQQIASGMAYMSQMSYLHRDLACRNILVDEAMVVKISDFGLACQLEGKCYDRANNSNGALLPIFWYPPEKLTSGIFETKSDVWSFGVVMWEIFTLCKDRPYQNITSAELLTFIVNGGRLNKPALSDEYLYSKVMLECWASNRDDRPTFNQISEDLHAWEIQQPSAHHHRNVPNNNSTSYYVAAQRLKDLKC